jgi:hypothetical protein
VADSESSTPGKPGTARDAFLGYVYQAEVALLGLTRRRVESANPEWALTIEVFDDVAFQRGKESPEEFLQSKGSLNNARPVTDTSPDIWKTLRNWTSLVDGRHHFVRVEPPAFRSRRGCLSRQGFVRL